MERNTHTALTGFPAVRAFLLLIISLGIVFADSGCVQVSRKVDTLQMLRRLGHNDKLKQQALNQETANFRRLKSYIQENEIKSGISAGTALKKFGHPVSVLTDREGQSWAYKPSGVDWVGGEKIYLFFDQKGSLVDWECVNCT
ncbi:MAG: hypothetical protein PVI33_06835 [Candidatus Omnitrophota bacterium]|jgi:hypothetical protein